MIRTFLNWLRGKPQHFDNVPYIRADNGSVAALSINTVNLKRRADDE